MTYELSDYQHVSLDFLRASTCGGLFDSPGVGKTPPTIVAGAEKSAETSRPVLVTAPAYLLDNWEYEIGRFAPGARVVKANGRGADARHEALATPADFILTSYNNWSAKGKGAYVYPELAGEKWAATVFDEGHRLRGRSSQGTKHVFKMRLSRASNLATPIWCLTGTPIVNNPGDLYPLLHLLDKREYSSYWDFVGEYCKVVTTPWSTQVGQLRKGMDDAFRELLGSFSLRRTLADIPSLASLDHRERDYLVPLPASVVKMFRDSKKEYILEHPELDRTEFVNGGGALYSRLRQLATVPPTAAKPKIDFCRDFLEDHFAPVVVYCWYKDSARAVAEALQSKDRPVTLITGDIPTTRRSGLVDKWASQPNGVLVATIASLKEGISLVHAQDVVFLEHSELPADQEQCVARLKRRGQQGLVNVHNVFAKDSPDMAIRKHLKDRNLGLKRALTSWLREA